MTLATTQRRAEHVESVARHIKEWTNTTSLHAGNLNNGIKAVDEHRGWSLTDGSLARGVSTRLLGQNARTGSTISTPSQAVVARAA